MKTEIEYREGLTEVERLFNALPGTAEGDRLDMLVLLVEAYEEQHYSIPPPDPIAALEYHLESRGLDRRD